MKLRTLFLICCALCTVRELDAQNDSIKTRRMHLIQQLEPGTRIRVRVAGEMTAGRLRSVSRDTLYLEDSAFATQDLQRLWIQQRATRKGRNIGALVGAPVGGLFGIFVVWLADALCEGSCNGLSAGEVILAGTGFSALGLLSGGTLGATIGAGIPRWGEITDKRTRIPEDPDAPIGSFAVIPAYTHFPDSDGGGFGGRAVYSFETSVLAVGLEAGSYHPGTTRHITFPLCGPGIDCTDTTDVKTDVFHAGAVLRLMPGTFGRLQPYPTIGLGVYNWGFGPSGGNTLVGYSIGGGVQLRDQRRRHGLFAEARWHNNLSRSGSEAVTRYGFYTVGVGAAIAW